MLKGEVHTNAAEDPNAGNQGGDLIGTADSSGVLWPCGGYAIG